ncbi:hypothetical protein [Amycolatopsis sp.]|uniref:hypothetical protein n=1 Tax=Amycolatopsis sp. TaxID=37632 RepID=UPI002B8D436D|nr:hypothetical protein [Amycolatopsis sp.]HVV07971.1 hypothetical protein [Amycolatopsis sp.]
MLPVLAGPFPGLRGKPGEPGEAVYRSPVLDEMPETVGGKILKFELRQRFA